METTNEAGEAYLAKLAVEQLKLIRAEMIATNPVIAALVELDDSEAPPLET